MNISAVAVLALIVGSLAALGVVGLMIWAMDVKPGAIRERRANRAFRCPCGHDFVFHARTGTRSCRRHTYEGACGCQGYRGEIPAATIAEILEGQP